MGDGRVTGELFGGLWADAGTPERLAQIDTIARNLEGDDHAICA
jgi:hypothetical protein